MVGRAAGSERAPAPQKVASGGAGMTCCLCKGSGGVIKYVGWHPGASLHRATDEADAGLIAEFLGT